MRRSGERPGAHWSQYRGVCAGCRPARGRCSANSARWSFHGRDRGSLALAPEPAAIVGAMSAAVAAGGIDGGSMVPGRVADDGIAAETVAALVALMRAAVEMHLAGS